jgi:hypothetical protein
VNARAARPDKELTPADRQRLEAAHRRLREAVAAYERFLGQPLTDEVPGHNLQDVAAAQAKIEDAERELWRLREELLGWSRPAWDPGAARVSDWLSDEDRVYDDH